MQCETRTYRSAFPAVIWGREPQGLTGNRVDFAVKCWGTNSPHSGSNMTGDSSHTVRTVEESDKNAIYRQQPGLAVILTSWAYIGCLDIVVLVCVCREIISHRIMPTKRGGMPHDRGRRYGTLIKTIHFESRCTGHDSRLYLIS